MYLFCFTLIFACHCSLESRFSWIVHVTGSKWEKGRNLRNPSLRYLLLVKINFFWIKKLLHKCSSDIQSHPHPFYLPKSPDCCLLSSYRHWHLRRTDVFQDSLSVENHTGNSLWSCLGDVTSLYTKHGSWVHTSGATRGSGSRGCFGEHSRRTYGGHRVFEPLVHRLVKLFRPHVWDWIWWVALWGVCTLLP